MAITVIAITISKIQTLIFDYQLITCHQLTTNQDKPSSLQALTLGRP